MDGTLKFLIIFGVVYVAFKVFLFYRLNKTLRQYEEKKKAAGSM